MGKVHVRRTNMTEHVQTFTEKEVGACLSHDLANRAGVDMKTVTKTVMVVHSKDGSTGPYQEYEVTLTVDHEAGGEP